MRIAVLAVLLLSAVLASAKYDTRFLYGLKINATGNVTLTADGFLPVPKNSSERFPALIFPNSWGVPEIEYIAKVLGYAERGFVGIEYQTRGWYLSGGEIDTAGPLDRADTDTLYEFVCSNAAAWQVNVERIAFVGISYGAGISIMAIGHNPKIRTAVALSGWDEFDNGFYYYRSPAKKELASLLHTGEKDGRIPPSLTSFYSAIVHHQNMSAVHDFANSRSPEYLYLDKINANKSPIFLSNNMNDRLFFPQTKTRFFSRLQGPKFQLLNQGMHAEPEALGLVDLPHNYIWTKVSMWLDYWLKDINNGIMDEEPIHVQSGKSIFSENYTRFTAWPDPVKSNPLTFYFSPRGNAMYGGLNQTAADSSVVDTIMYEADPGLNEGPSDKASSLGDQPTFNFPQVTSPGTSIVYVSDPLQEDTQICGNPSMNLTLTVPADGNWQVYAYMYEVSGDVGTLLGDAMYTSWSDDSSQSNSGSGTTTVNLSDIILRTVCRLIPAGNSLGVAFVLGHTWYSPASTSSSLAVGFNYGAEASFTFPRVTRP